MREHAGVNLDLAEGNVVGKRPVPNGRFCFSAQQLTTRYRVAGAGEEPIEKAANRHNDEYGQKHATNYIPRLLFAHDASPESLTGSCPLSPHNLRKRLAGRPKT